MPIQQDSRICRKACLGGVYKGRDEFPISTTASYDLLQHISVDTGYYRPKRRRFNFRRNNKQYGRVSFFQRGSGNVIPGRDGKKYPHIKCHNCEEPGHYANQCPNPKKNVTLAHFTLTQKELKVINKTGSFWTLVVQSASSAIPI